MKIVKLWLSYICVCIQEQIEYTVIGDYAAPAFFGVISDKGNITIINQGLLRKDVGTSYTVIKEPTFEKH